MTLIKYNANRPATFSNFIDRFFNDEYFDGKRASTFSPQVDIVETEKEFELQFHLPGMKKEDIHIDINDDRLTVSGERKMEKETKEKNFRSVESYYGTFSRSFYLPDNANTDKVAAAYKDGILSIVIPKEAKEEKKKTIAIK